MSDDGDGKAGGAAARRLLIGAVAAATSAADRAALASARQPMLYCEFYNFAALTPKVGFFFAVAGKAAAPAFEQVFQREIDGSQTDFLGDGDPRPAWAFDGSEDPATLRSPDGAIQINLYGYGPAGGTTWFEAGLRSVQYLNLGGKCRRSAA